MKTLFFPRIPLEMYRGVGEGHRIPVVEWRACIYSQIGTNSKDQVGVGSFSAFLLLMLSYVIML